MLSNQNNQGYGINNNLFIIYVHKETQMRVVFIDFYATEIHAISIVRFIFEWFGFIYTWLIELYIWRNKKMYWIYFEWVNERLLFNANSAIFQLYHGESKLIFNEMMIRSALF